MSSLEYGYIGNAPTQRRTGNTGIFSMQDVVDLDESDKWRWQDFPSNTGSAELDIYLDAKEGSVSGTTIENIAASDYGSGIGNFTAVNGITHDTSEANFFGSFNFNGSNDYMYRSYDSDFSGWRHGMTISFFLKRDDYNGRQNIWNIGYGGLGTITLETGGGANYYHGTGGSDNSPYQGSGAGFTLAIGEVANIVLCRRSSTVDWYKNGVQTSSKTNSYNPATNGSNNLKIGHGYAGYFDGMVYIVQCWDGELTNAEILQNYQYFAPRFGMT